MDDDKDKWAQDSPLLRAIQRTHAEELGDALNLLRLLWSIEHNLQVISRQLENRTGVTGPQLAVLRFVSLFPGISPSGLAEMLSLHPSTLTNVFKRLIARKALTREPDPDDKRRSRLHVTDEGRKIVADKRGTVEAAVERAVKAFPLEALRRTEAVLQGVSWELEAEVSRLPQPKR